MRRRLVLLNLALVALAGLAAWRIRVGWQQGAAEERRVLRAPAAGSVVPLAPLSAPSSVTAAAYNDVAQKMLFASDRNPRVEVVVAAPKPLPPFPAAYGMLDMGDGPVVIMSERAGGANRAYSPGDTIGGLLLAAIEGDELVFQWEGQEIRKNIADLKPKEGAPAPAAAQAAPSAGAQPTVQAASVTEAKPGAEMSEGIRACEAGDTSPSGTIRDGYRKVVSRWAFGERCHWEPVK